MGLSLEDLIRRGARGLIQKAIEVEVKELLEEYHRILEQFVEVAFVDQPAGTILFLSGVSG